MKYKFTSVILALCVVLSMFSLPAIAKNYDMSMDITYRNIKISLNGKEFIPKDTNGNYVEPFVSNGTTYLPVRAVSEALGLNVDWDNNSNTVALTFSSKIPTLTAQTSNGTYQNSRINITYKNIKITLNGKEFTPRDANGVYVEPFVCSGTTYLPVRAIGEALGLSVIWDNSSNTVMLSKTSFSDSPSNNPSSNNTNTGSNGNNYGYISDNTTVYVIASGKMHLIPNCSGMKRYTQMTYGKAKSNNYTKCKNCFN